MTSDGDRPGGLIRLRADLHTHAIGDGRFGANTADLVARHLDGALEAGLDVIGVTDHDDLRPGLLALEEVERRNLPLFVLAGMEVTTDDGHLVVLGLQAPLKPWRSMNETIALARARDEETLLIVPHPFFASLREQTGIDAIERLNHRYGDFDVKRDDIAVIASSDAHSAADLAANPMRTLLDVTEKSWSGVIDAIRNRRATIVPAGCCRGD
jgi:predicted metal-dependent phosphoesterase TrpH